MAVGSWNLQLSIGTVTAVNDYPVLLTFPSVSLLFLSACPSVAMSKWDYNKYLLGLGVEPEESSERPRSPDRDPPASRSGPQARSRSPSKSGPTDFPGHRRFVVFW